MAKKDKKAQSWVRLGDAKPHSKLEDEFVHVFVDDQNLFWGIVNDQFGHGYRIDFGQLLDVAAKDSSGKSRPIKSAYIAGVIPDEDSFWEVAKAQGFTVRRGYLGAGGRSKQDDAYLIADLVETVCEHRKRSTAVLVAGDADYAPALIKSLARDWRNEVAFIGKGVSAALTPLVHEFRTIHPKDIEYDRRGYRGAR